MMMMMMYVQRKDTTMKDYKIRIKKAEGNELSIAFRPAISSARTKTFEMPWRASSSFATNGIGDEGTMLLVLASKIEGISKIEISTLEVKIFKGDLYEWHEIVPALKESIKSATNCSDERIEDLNIYFQEIPA